MIIFVATIFIVLCIVALSRGFSVKNIAKMSWPGIKDSLIVVEVLMLIGCLTGIWRSSGTIAYFICAGFKIMPPSLFVLFAFLLCAAMSFAIGTSFGVVATAGVILMSIARAGNVNPVPVAGAVMSGIYVGDRNSPASSCAALVAAVTDTDININVRKMLKTSVLPLALSILAYLLISFIYPMKNSETSVVSMLENEFILSAICIIPAVLMIVLPFCKVKIKTSMLIDIIISLIIAIFLQKQTFADCLLSMVTGYKAKSADLSILLDGGGIFSMLSVCVILVISGTFGGILSGTGLLDRAYEIIDKIKNKVGRFATTVLLSVISCMVFCNQSIGIMMVNNLTEKLYNKESEKYDKMIDMENSVITIAGLVPWCIACSVPLATLGAGASALPFSFFLFLVPICYYFQDKQKLNQK